MAEGNGFNEEKKLIAFKFTTLTQMVSRLFKKSDKIRDELRIGFSEVKADIAELDKNHSIKFSNLSAKVQAIEDTLARQEDEGKRIFTKKLAILITSITLIFNVLIQVFIYIL